MYTINQCQIKEIGEYFYTALKEENTLKHFCVSQII